VLGHFGEPIEPGSGFRELRLFADFLPERNAQRHGPAIPGERKQIIVTETDESKGASQPSMSALFSGSTGSQISIRPGAASGSAICGGNPPASDETLAAMVLSLNTASTAARMFAPERNESLNSRYTKARRPL
jgi:hypothetical protein